MQDLNAVAEVPYQLATVAAEHAVEKPVAAAAVVVVAFVFALGAAVAWPAVA